MAYYNPYINPQYQNYGYQQPQTIQNGGFVTVQSEEEARAYPVAHGMSVTFRNENTPYIYTKTLGFSQMDSPVFEKYRLTKENVQDAHNEPKIEKSEDLPIYLTKGEFEPFREELRALKEQMEALRKELGDE